MGTIIYSRAEETATHLGRNMQYGRDLTCRRPIAWTGPIQPGNLVPTCPEQATAHAGEGMWHVWRWHYFAATTPASLAIKRKRYIFRYSYILQIKRRYNTKTSRPKNDDTTKVSQQKKSEKNGIILKNG